MTAPAMLCAALEVALNRTLRLEPAVLADCGRLAGRVIALDVDGPAWSFFIEFTEGGVRVLDQLDAEPDVRVAGGLGTLMRLAWQVTQGESGVPQGLRVDGDTELLSRFNQLLARAGFDPEELMAKVVGDTAAHRIDQGLRKLLGWGRQTAQTLGLDTAEYLREETRDLARAAD
ncbi:MAG TPA: SCP2 sterol-binding domain-containing protein, partial [Solimonas sp.]|nr:SCP2 sterol-binding domain-containing protein [Solimonas sp.]